VKSGHARAAATIADRMLVASVDLRGPVVTPALALVSCLVAVAGRAEVVRRPTSVFPLVRANSRDEDQRGRCFSSRFSARSGRRSTGVRPSGSR